jgi:hypothetical protein
LSDLYITCLALKWLEKTTLLMSFDYNKEKEKKNENKDWKGKGSTRHTPATTTGHQEGTEPKPGEETRATKGGDEQIKDEMGHTE